MVTRQPSEQRRVTIARAQMTLTFPASFVLIAAMNPHTCRFASDFRKGMLLLTAVDSAVHLEVFGQPMARATSRSASGPCRTV